MTGKLVINTSDGDVSIPLEMTTTQFDKICAVDLNSKRNEDEIFRELENIMRKIANKNRSSPIVFTSQNDVKQVGGYTIMYNYKNQCLECGATGHWAALGDVVFETEEKALEAMSKYKEALLWYFQEMAK